MSAQSEALEALKQRVLVDVTHLQDTIVELSGELSTALSNDAADAATIAEKQARIDELLADAQATIDGMNAVDPIADFPEPPPA